LDDAHISRFRLGLDQQIDFFFPAAGDKAQRTDLTLIDERLPTRRGGFGPHQSDNAEEAARCMADDSLAV
jgi:hypothetical protein